MQILQGGEGHNPSYPVRMNGRLRNRYQVFGGQIGKHRMMLQNYKGGAIHENIKAGRIGEDNNSLRWQYE